MGGKSLINTSLVEAFDHYLNRLFPLARSITGRGNRETLNILKLVCKIINVDKNIDPFESNFVRRLSGLLYITDRQAGEIKKEFLDS